MPGITPRLAERPGRVWRTGPALGQDNELVYREYLGLPADRMADLQARGVI
jgi:formyl-CoA transferase